MCVLSPDSFRVRKLRFRAGNRADPLSLRLSLESALAGADLRPASLPVDAILCIRRLPPLVLARRLPGIESRTQRDHWQCRFRDAMDHCAARAARPAQGAIGAESEAVVFADLAELLACLVRDWLREETAGNWWWDALFPGRNLAEAIAQAWVDAPQHAPAAITRLMASGLAGEFLRALPTATVAAISANIARAFALAELRSAILSIGVESANGNAPGKRGSAPNCRETARGMDPGKEKEPVREAPWARWVQVDPDLPAESKSVLVLSALLIRAPAVVRSLRFAGDVRAFAEGCNVDREIQARPKSRLAGVENGSTGHHRVTRPGPAPKVVPQLTRDAPGAGGTTPYPVGRSRAEAQENGPGPREIARDQGLPIEQEARLRTGRWRVESASPDDGETIPGRAQVPVAQETVPAASRAAPQAGDLVAVPAAPAESVYSTRWGGAFYLIHVALSLGLYGDFTQPRHPSLPLPLWDFLALIGHRMIGPPFAEDPIWDLFAALSGRAADEPPGAWFEPPDVWPGLDDDAGENPPVPSSPFDPPALLVPASSLVGSKRVNSPAGAPPPPHTGAADRDGAQPIPGGNSLERWVNRVARLIECRVSRALRRPDRGALRELVFPHDAQVSVTDERVAVRFSLAAHPVQLRLAGLDRDPGWVPAAGRAVVFHYD